LNSRGNQLSGGEQQMLAIARALMGNPGALLMDEPSEGLAPVVIEQLVDAMRSFAGDGSMSILLVEQRIDLALDLADRCATISIRSMRAYNDAPWLADRAAMRVPPRQR
jgi:branched-chain amino acid transport system ATP-binding protein